MTMANLFGVGVGGVVGGGVGKVGRTVNAKKRRRRRGGDVLDDRTC
jgi:hypothetical protein